VLAALLLAAGTVAATHAQDVGSAVSVDRVRAALEQPPSKLTLVERKPDFSIETVWHHPFHEIFDVPPWATPKVGWQPPAVGFNLLSVIQTIAKSASDAKHEHDERAAHEDVLRAIAGFCAAQPDGGARIQICSTSPAIR
jgi:hypothetical protein